MDEIIARLGLALAIGLLVGLERGWQERNAPDRSRTAGIRTFGISGLLGGVLAALAQAFNTPSMLVAGFLGFTVVLAWYKAREAVHDEDFSVTGVVAGLAVFALGALAVAGDYRAAAAGGAALAAVLASRELLHGLLRRLTWVELRSALILAVMTTVVLPLLPDRTVDPWGGFNPREVWIFTVLIAAISYAGYVAVRVFGPTRGLLVSAVTGAVVSSTAVTVALARSATAVSGVSSLAGAACLAALVSIVRVMVIVLMLEPAVAVGAAPVALTAASVFAVGGLFLLSRVGDRKVAEAPMRNPFELGPLLVFAAFFAVASVLSALLAGFVGSSGVLAVSVVSALFDVDIAVLSALRLAKDVASTQVATLAVLLALAVNAIGRLGLAMISGPFRFSAPLLVVTAIAFVFGIAGLTLGAAF
ncbi:MgtC/SapB family protein [Aminobacter carboxidus]|uniref:MgtC/SapB family protein n=1 Tax=Aminobacter carboxidus TaxID=376165 RepID=A0ABR9GGK5_9HYPH|nr:MgtC/SapB family protein [Aminobacter carboxidus]MBE1202806.1 MgtC/SapB family protein [Aminobacter carboxidus]